MAPGDRRSKVRFEVFGSFWGTFDSSGAVELHDLTPHGALIEANQPLAIESVQSVCLIWDGQPAGRRRPGPARQAFETDHSRFLMGIEFVSTSTPSSRLSTASSPSDLLLPEALPVATAQKLHK
jgi:hypothetical protein